MEDKEVIFNLGLLLEPSWSEKLTKYSQTLLACQHGFYVLGSGSIPHVTLLQFPGREGDVENIWNKINLLCERPISLDFLGYSLELWNQWYCFWLRVRCTQELQALQTDAIKALRGFNFLNGTGEKYDPHLTLLAWEDGHTLPPFPICSEFMNLKSIRAVLTLGKSGPRFQYAECLRRKMV